MQVHHLIFVCVSLCVGSDTVGEIHWENGQNGGRSI